MASYNIQVGHNMSGMSVGSNRDPIGHGVPPMTTTIQVGDAPTTNDHRPQQWNDPRVVALKATVVAPIPPKCPVVAHVPLESTQNSKGDATIIMQEDVQNGFFLINKPGHYYLGESLVFDFMDVNDTQVIANKLNPLFFGGFRTADASVGIAICCDDVHLHGNGHSIRQSLRSALTNRVFTLIEVSANSRAAAGSHKGNDGLGDNVVQVKDCPLYAGNNDRSVAGGGPSHVDDNYSENAGLKNITVEGVHFGRSSHFSIHGTNNRNLVVRNCKFIDFEIAAIWLNNPVLPILQKLEIVGLQLVQPPTYLQGFGTQGSGRFGVVNASYWGIIFNQSYGGVNLTFPQPSAGTLDSLHGGVPSDFANALVEDYRRGLGGKSWDTGNETNFQRIGARGGLVEDVHISELSTIATSGVCVSRMRLDGVCVPILTRIDKKPGSYTSLAALQGTAVKDRVTPFGQGFKGMRFNKHLCIEAVRDFRAFYVNKYCIQWMQANLAGADLSVEEKDALGLLLGRYRVVIDDPTDENLIHLEDVAGNVISDEDQHTWGRYGFKMLKLDTATTLVHGTEPAHKRYSYVYDPKEYGYSYYRGVDGDRSENFLYAFSSCEPMVDACYPDNLENSYGLPSSSIVSYQTLQATTPSTQSAFAVCFKHGQGDMPYGRFDTDVTSYANVQVPSVVLPVKESWLVKHAVDMFGQPWHTSKDVSFQLARGMPLDEGGHSFNGLVAIHCDRMWGVTFRNVNIVNATNLRTETQDWKHIFFDSNPRNTLYQVDTDEDTNKKRFCYRVPVIGYGDDVLMIPSGDKYTDAAASWDHVKKFLPDDHSEPAFYGRFEWDNVGQGVLPETYTFPYFDVFGDVRVSTPAYRAFNGFSGSSWGLMMNDSGGNIVENVNVLNMLGRGGVSFAIHAAFGSRGNTFKHCSVMSCTAAQIWGFVADKGASGNIFDDCTASNLTGGIAAAGFVLRGPYNVIRNSKSLDMRVVVPSRAATPGTSEIMSAYDEFNLFAPMHERVVVSVLEGSGGADEHEYVGRRMVAAGNSYIHESNLFLGNRAIYSSNLDRNREVMARKKTSSSVAIVEKSVPDGYHPIN
jgi:hypothetical protein